MTTKEIQRNGIMVFVPVEASDLIARKIELENMDEDDPQTLSELWRCLGDDYAQIGYLINAEKCAKKALYYRQIGAF